MPQVVAGTLNVQCLILLSGPKLYVVSSSGWDHRCKIYQIVAGYRGLKCLTYLLGPDIYRISGSSKKQRCRLFR